MKKANNSGLLPTASRGGCNDAVSNNRHCEVAKRPWQSRIFTSFILSFLFCSHADTTGIEPECMDGFNYKKQAICHVTKVNEKTYERLYKKAITEQTLPSWEFFFDSIPSFKDSQTFKNALTQSFQAFTRYKNQHQNDAKGWFESGIIACIVADFKTAKLHKEVLKTVLQDESRANELKLLIHLRKQTLHIPSKHEVMIDKASWSLAFPLAYFGARPILEGLCAFALVPLGSQLSTVFLETCENLYFFLPYPEFTAPLMTLLIIRPILKPLLSIAFDVYYSKNKIK